MSQQLEEELVKGIDRLYMQSLRNECLENVYVKRTGYYFCLKISTYCQNLLLTISFINFPDLD